MTFIHLGEVLQKRESEEAGFSDLLKNFLSSALNREPSLDEMGVMARLVGSPITLQSVMYHLTAADGKNWEANLRALS